MMMTYEPEMLESIVSDLRELNHPLMAEALSDLYKRPEFLDLGPLELLRKILTPEYDEKMSKKINSRLARAHLSGCTASLESCADSLERLYKPAGSASVLRSLKFLESGVNVCLFGASGSGKTYFAKALAVQACSQTRAEYHHCADLLENLSELKETKFESYRKRIGALERLPLLVIDDFLLQPVITQQEMSILFAIFELRKEAHHSTIICSQRNPDAWKSMLCNDEAMANAIVSRVTHGAYNVLIQMQPAG